MKKIKLVLDVDGVLLNFLQSISEFISDHYSIESNLHFSHKQYDLELRFHQEIVDDFSNIKNIFESKGLWKNLQAMPNIEQIHDLFVNPAFDIHFLTSLPVHLHSDRLENLQAVIHVDIKPEQLTCVPLGVSKRDYLHALKCDYFVEDNLKNLVECYTPNHKSLWINLEESVYDHSHADALSIAQFSTLNACVEHLYADISKVYSKHAKIVNKIK